VTIGEIKDPEAYSILELVSNGQGGLRMPQLNTEERNDLTTEAFESAELAQGLAIFNTDTKCLEFWNGTKWITISQANATVFSITTQPKKFTFYESAEGDDEVVPLTFTVAGTDWTYQWYQLVGNNVHTRVGTPMGETGTITVYSGATTNSFTPAGVIKGTNRDAGNVGFYRFYCVAQNTSSGINVTSDIAEVAVGCGAKTIDGEWLSFMCFNLGAAEFTIGGQMTYEIGTFVNNADGVSGRHAYIENEEKLWGDLYQWGRVADGHEKRNSPFAVYSITAPPGFGVNAKVPGSWKQALNDTTEYVVNEVATEVVTEYEGRFITMTYEQNFNWAYGLAATYQDMLWRNYRFENDPCARLGADGNYNKNGNDQILMVSTDWRTPTAEEWSSIYRGNSASGTPAAAIANAWEWHGGTATTISSSRGYKIKPDGATTTLFLPANGYRDLETGTLFQSGGGGYYWSNSLSGVNASRFYFGYDGVTPVITTHRGQGFALRCIKNQ
jgi:hypothetical protein